MTRFQCSEIRQHGDHIEVLLTQGKVALIDPDDFDLVVPHKWYAQRKSAERWYAARTFHDQRGCRQLAQMHRVIVRPPADMQVDHINGNGLDNRRCNLRLATCFENRRNQRRLLNGKSSRFKGVHWSQKAQLWVAGIRLEGKQVRIGTFALEEDAGAAYDEAARAHFGEFACTNADLAEAQL